MHGTIVLNGYRKRLALATGIAIAAVTVLSTGPLAQGAAPQGAVPPAGGGRTARFNTIAARFEKGEPAFNGEAWQLLPDMEHDAFRLDDVEKALHDLKPKGAPRPVRTPIVRIPYESDQDYRHFVKQLLDSGLMGIIVPGVETAEQARYLVRAMRYPPQRVTKWDLREPPGVRGWNPSSAIALWGWTPDQYAAAADLWPLNPDGELMAIGMIETPEAIKNIREILAVPGLSAVMIGQSDLSIALGVGTPAANTGHPEVEAAVQQVARACVEMKKLCGSYQGDVKTRVAMGFRLFTAQRGDFKAPTY